MFGTLASGRVVAPGGATARSARSARRRHFAAAASSEDPFDAYDVLGVPDNADASQIRKAYKSLQKRFHPDVYRGDDVAGRSADINRAYDVLSEKESRVDLDNALMKANGGKRRNGGGRTVISASGLVGPLREKFLMRMDVCGGDDGGGRACDINVASDLAESVREWGKMLAFTSVGPGRYCSPRRRMPFNSSIEGSKCVG